MNPTAALLKRIVMYDGVCSVKEVARIAGLAESTVYDNLSGRNNPSLEVVRAAFLASRDPRLKRLLEPEGWELSEVSRPKAPTEDWEKETGDVYIALSALHSEVREAMESGNMKPNALARILKGVDEVSRQVAELRSLAEEFMDRNFRKQENKE